jgi:hypothetical protein
MEMQKTRGPQTLRGTYKSIKRTHLENGLPVPSLRGAARSIVRAGASVWAKAVVEDTERWLAAKDGGTRAEKKARADHRKDRKAANYAAKLAKKSKGKFKQSGEGGEKKKKGRGK